MVDKKRTSLLEKEDTMVYYSEWVCPNCGLVKFGHDGDEKCPRCQDNPNYNPCSSLWVELLIWGIFIVMSIPFIFLFLLLIDAICQLFQIL